MKKTLTTLAVCCSTLLAYSQDLKTLVAYPNSFSQIHAIDIKASIDSSSLFNEVDIRNMSAGIPPVDSLLQYNSILVFPNGGYSNTVAFGDSLAKYVDLGGGVVDASFSNADPGSTLGGNFVDYNLIQSMSGIGSGTMGNILVPEHPIMENIDTFSANAYVLLNIVTNPNVDIIAEYTDDTPLVLARENVGPLSVRRAYLNFFPGSANTAGGSWGVNTDGALLIANALKWVSSPSTPSAPEYCASRSTRNRFEWIKNVTLSTDINNQTGADGNGYGDYTEEILEVDTGDVVTVSLTPGYRRRAYREYWRIWADWNYDGDFDDAGEKVFETNGKNVRTGSFTIPTNVDANDLRLRVSMRWKRYASACANFRNGEVEDYTIRVNGAAGYSAPAPTRMAQPEYFSGESFVEIAEIFNNPVQSGTAISGIVRTSETGDKAFYLRNTLGQVVKSEQVNCIDEESEFEISTTGLKSGIYFLTVDADQEALKVVIQ